jgi:hypothetical protein
VDIRRAYTRIFDWCLFKFTKHIEKFTKHYGEQRIWPDDPTRSLVHFRFFLARMDLPMKIHTPRRDSTP